MDGYEALRNTVAWIDLSARGKICVTGEDRARLLHAMTTNHVQDLGPGHGLYAFFLNDKGRILGDANIYNLSGALLLDTEPETKDKLFEHLDRFIIADDVTLEDETDLWGEIGLEGPQSLEMAARLHLPVADGKRSIAFMDQGFTARVASTGAKGLRIFVKATAKEQWLAALTNAGVEPATAAEARTVRLENGVPRYGDDISERYLVQETQVSEAMHFHKGCYLGQEIVERVRSRGQVHRLLTPIRIAGTICPAAGTKLTADGAPAGEISSVAFSPALGQVVGLAYLRTEVAQAKAAMTVDGTEPRLAAFVT